MGTHTTVRRLVDERLRTQPRTSHLYLTDATFRAACEQGRVALEAVLDQLDADGVAPFVAQSVIRGALVRLLDDTHVDQVDQFVRVGQALADGIDPELIERP